MDMLTRAGAGERFWGKVTKDSVSGCWIWIATRNSSGYGSFWVEGSMRMAHRLAYEESVGVIPDGAMLDHLCFNRACVRPQHLRPVSNKQNQEHRQAANLNSSSGARGVSWDPRGNGWRARAWHNGRKLNAGTHATVFEAERAAARLRASLFTHDDFARGGFRG